jgi:translation elongation factor P/translation initiation factor 5A
MGAADVDNDYMDLPSQHAPPQNMQRATSAIQADQEHYSFEDDGQYDKVPAAIDTDRTEDDQIQPDAEPDYQNNDGVEAD